MAPSAPCKTTLQLRPLRVCAGSRSDLALLGRSAVGWTRGAKAGIEEMSLLEEGKRQSVSCKGSCLLPHSSPALRCPLDQCITCTARPANLQASSSSRPKVPSLVSAGCLLPHACCPSPRARHALVLTWTTRGRPAPPAGTAPPTRRRRRLSVSSLHPRSDRAASSSSGSSSDVGCGAAEGGHGVPGAQQRQQIRLGSAASSLQAARVANAGASPTRSLPSSSQPPPASATVQPAGLRGRGAAGGGEDRGRDGSGH